MRTGKLAFVAAPGTFVTLTVENDGIVWADSAGMIEGVVVDKTSGDPLPGVTVIVTSPAMKRTETAITDENGRYKVTGLPTGTYLVTFYYLDRTIERANVGATTRWNGQSPIDAGGCANT